MTKEFKQLERYPSYEINEEGKVRNIETKKYKKLCTDKKGRSIVTLPHEDGHMVCEYICELLEEHFGIVCQETFAPDLLEEYREKARQAEEVAKARLAELEAAKAELQVKASENAELAETLKQVEKLVPTRKLKAYIIDTETGIEYKGFSKAARALGFNYDAFYNAFYLTEDNTISYEGHTFRKEMR